MSDDELDDEIIENGIVYSITGLETGYMYIGSTGKTLNQRISNHKCCKNCMAIVILDNEIYDTEILESFKNIYRKDLIKKEVEYQKLYGDMIINKRNECRTKKEWREDNKEIIYSKKKEYRENNKEIISSKKKEYRENNKEIILNKKKEFYENNKDKILSQQKIYYERNKEIISNKGKLLVTCDRCNLTLSKSCLTRHKNKYCKI